MKLTASTLQGWRVKKITKGVTFIALPKELWREAGTCNCSFCKGKLAFWDTLVVPNEENTTTYTVHAPELQPESYR